MYKKKYSRLIFSIVVAIVLTVVAFVIFNQQKKERDEYFLIRNGNQVEARLVRLPGWTYKDGKKTKYLYIFSVEEDGVVKEYANVTRREYPISYENENIKFLINYAVKNSRPITDGSKTQEIVEKIYETDDSEAQEIVVKTYELALSAESAYFLNSFAPTFTASKVLFCVAGLILIYVLFLLGWIMFYKNIEKNGILTYAIFIEAFCAKGGSSRFMAIKYKYKDLNDNWIEVTSPHTFSALMCERLMLMQTFKIRYKGKYSMIAEEIKTVRI